MHLDLFIRHCFPKWSNVFTIANKIMSDLSKNDQEFYDHLKTISKIRVKLNPKVHIFILLTYQKKLSFHSGFFSTNTVIRK
jgi:hypothetical protein